MTLVSQGLGCDPIQRRSVFELLDFVALATVADLVKLNSPVNRYIVKTGLQFMNNKERTCWAMALEDKEANVGTLGFQLGPRVNAASRMSGVADSAIGFLTSDDHDAVKAYYVTLCDYNDKRKKIEQDMEAVARKQSRKEDPCIIAYDQSFDPGVQGIVAGRLVEKFGKPAVMLADVPGTEFVTGSCRGGQFLHVRDVLQTIADTNEGFFESFGGHAAAAGLKFHQGKVGAFKTEFVKALEAQLADEDTTPFIETDGSLKGILNIATHNSIQDLSPYGMGFATPVFHDTMTVTSARMVGANPVHLKLELDGIEAIKFYAIQNADDPMPVQHGDRVEVLYQTDLNVWKGQESLQLIVKRLTVV
jgi:single-stranded-DNA-specific exonuclease